MSPAQRAYEAYARAFPGPAGIIARPWLKLPLYERAAWTMAVLEVVKNTKPVTWWEKVKFWWELHKP